MSSKKLDKSKIKIIAWSFLIAICLWYYCQPLAPWKVVVPWVLSAAFLIFWRLEIRRRSKSEIYPRKIKRFK